MEMTRLSPTLVLVRGMLPINVYLVQEEDGFTLVDTGLPGWGAHLRQAARDLGGEIQRVTLTHSHLDHAGALDEIIALCPGVEFSLGARETLILCGNLKPLPHEPQVKLSGSFAKRKSRPSRELLPGNRVGSLQVVDAAGHTPGHIAFFDPRDGSLIAGDSWQTKGGLAVSGQLRWRFPFPAWATWHKLTALVSARAMVELNPSRLVVGHGDPLESPIAAMRATIDGE
jgi:glyoxylase-like metal-dependent hydrolase (beta-lactamase superfamily II)